MTIRIELAPLSDAKTIHAAVPEFTPGYLDQYEGRTQGRNHAGVFVAYVDGAPAGYLIGYEDAGEMYCWMTAVLPAHRRSGLFGALMRAFEEWARSLGYSTLRLKTWNERREMLSFLVRDGWMFTDVEARGRVEEYRIVARKSL